MLRFRLIMVLKLAMIFTVMVAPSLQQSIDVDHSGHQEGRQGKNLLNWIGLGTGPETDPYLSQANSACLNGDLSECFKSRALGTFDEFFSTKDFYQLTENAKVMRMPDSQLRMVMHEPFEFSEKPRLDEPEWDQLVKFVLRKVERFMKSTALEITVDNDVTDHGRYSPRFVDEIADEIDLIEDKRDTIFNRKQLKKLFIPLLLVLKIFKLKLLLFLPLILGLASFKKFLGFLAIIVPGAIAYFKLCKPDFQSAFGGYQQGHYGPQYSPAGIGFRPHFREPQPSFVEHNDYGGGEYSAQYGGGAKGFTFKDNPSQSLAYSGYYRNTDKGIPAEEDKQSVVTKKSILPDSK